MPTDLKPLDEMTDAEINREVAERKWPGFPFKQDESGVVWVPSPHRHEGQSDPDAVCMCEDGGASWPFRPCSSWLSAGPLLEDLVREADDVVLCGFRTLWSCEPRGLPGRIDGSDYADPLTRAIALAWLAWKREEDKEGTDADAHH